MPARRSLKSRALQLLAQRDHSRLELRRKLLLQAGAATPDTDSAVATEQIDGLLDWLEAQGFLSNERFIESRVHARQARFGVLRIKNELARHALVLPTELGRALADSESARALAIRERRFPGAPGDAIERARQVRFLIGRGFSPELVHRLIRRLLDRPKQTELSSEHFDIAETRSIRSGRREG